MTLQDLLDQFTDKDIFAKLFKLYPDQRKSKAGYKAALFEMRNINPKTTDMTILVHTVPPNDLNDEEYVSVSGRYPKEPDTNYAIEFEPWDVWLGANLHPDTTYLPPLDALCHCLWEMTWRGYSDKEVQTEAKELFGHMAEVMKDIDAKTRPSELP